MPAAMMGARVSYSRTLGDDIKRTLSRVFKRDTRRALLHLCSGYLLGLFAWYAVRLALGDATPWLFALNALALYLFLPLPLVLLIAIATRHRGLWVGIALAVLLWGHLWGALFIPRGASMEAGEATLTVMTYNLLGDNTATESIVQTLRESGADIIGLQELNPIVARAIEASLSSDYPHQDLHPQVGVSGSGIISRYPFEVTGETIEHDHWVSPPRIIRIPFEDQLVTLVSFHALAHPQGHIHREEQARRLAAYASEHEGPLIMLGDLNATSTNVAYSIMTDVLDDAWRKAGFGFGHTFPGASKSVSRSSARPDFLGITVPQWLVRIDFVFYSHQLHAEHARTGRFDGASDHRPVIAVLRLQ